MRSLHNPCLINRVSRNDTWNVDYWCLLEGSAITSKNSDRQSCRRHINSCDEASAITYNNSLANYYTNCNPPDPLQSPETGNPENAIFETKTWTFGGGPT